MPSLSPTMTHGTISAWKRKPGDELKAGDVLCEIETDKASVGFDVQDDAVLAKILVQAHGPEIKCGEPIAITVEDLAAYEKFLSSPDQISLAVSTPPVASKSIETMTNSTHSPSNSGRTPLIKFIGKRILLSGTTTSSITAISTVSHAPVPISIKSTPSFTPSIHPVNDKYTDIPNSNMRKVIAKRLTESKATVPHLYSSIEIEIDELLQVRKQLKKDFDLNVSVNDLVIKSAALALRDVPQVNSKWDRLSNQVVPSPSIDISVAVATPNGNIQNIYTIFINIYIPLLTTNIITIIVSLCPQTLVEIYNSWVAG